MSRKNRNNKQRKERNLAARTRLFEPKELTDEQRARQAARAQRRVVQYRARGHAGVVIHWEFSGIAVPLDPDKPTENLREKTAIQRALLETLPKQTH